MRFAVVPDRRTSDQIGIVRVAGEALVRRLPVRRRRVEKLNGRVDRKRFGERFGGRIVAVCAIRVLAKQRIDNGSNQGADVTETNNDRVLQCRPRD